MARSSVTNLIHAVHNGVERSVVAYGLIGAVEVVVDSARQTYDREVVFSGKDASTGERTVATDNHEGIDAFFLKIFVCQTASFFGFELSAASCLEDSTAELNDVRHILCLKLHNLVGYKAFVAAIYTFHFKAIVDSCTSHRSDGGVHAGGVAS